VRPAALLLATLLGCTAPNPAYRVSGDARVDRMDLGAVSDGSSSDSGQSDSSGSDRRDRSGADGSMEDQGPTGDGPITAVSGLVLHWRFDDPSGSVALDSSGHGFDGTYSGADLPTPSTEVPPTTFANPGSRHFVGTATNSVQLASMPAALRPTQALTVSVWFRTTQTTRGDLVSHGGDYFIRWDVEDMEFVRRRPPGSASSLVSAAGVAPAANDGRWHHAAGVASVDGDTEIYLDGVRIDHDISRLPFTYAAAPSALIVGRAMSGGQPFDGWLDEVRIYDRALSAAEIQALARGQP
jgi:hypothetical protein